MLALKSLNSTAEARTIGAKGGFRLIASPRGIPLGKVPATAAALTAPKVALLLRSTDGAVANFRTSVAPDDVTADVITLELNG